MERQNDERWTSVGHPRPMSCGHWLVGGMFMRWVMHFKMRRRSPRMRGVMPRATTRLTIMPQHRNSPLTQDLRKTKCNNPNLVHRVVNAAIAATKNTSTKSCSHLCVQRQASFNMNVFQAMRVSVFTPAFNTL